MRTYMILLIGCLTVYSVSACDKDNYEYLLCADSIKYWDRITPYLRTEGLAFQARGYQPFWYDENRYYSYDSAQEIAFKKVWRINDNNLEIQLYHDSIPVGDKEIFQIVRLTENSLILSRSGYRMLYVKSKYQSTKLSLNPEQRRGYRVAEVASHKQIEELIKTTYKVSKRKKVTSPIDFYINIHIKLDKNGFVKDAIILEKSLNISKYNIFYAILLSRLKNIRFIPAHNDYTGETYDCNFILPIKYCH